MANFRTFVFNSCDCDCDIHQGGDGVYLKFADTKELSQTGNQPLKAETLRCKECETYYGSDYEDLYKCRKCVWYPDVHDYFIQRKASAV